MSAGTASWRAKAEVALAVVAEVAGVVAGVVVEDVELGVAAGSAADVVGFGLGRKPGAGASCAYREEEKSSGSKSAVRKFMVGSLEERRYHSSADR